jgi:alpha-tubulin suppressor-like RCC1 family protein
MKAIFLQYLIEFIIMKLSAKLILAQLLVVSVTQQIVAQCFKQISAVGHHTLALKTDGTLWATGDNASGQLGDGTIISKSSYIQIGSASNWAIVSAGYIHSIAIKTDGTLWAWGRNNSGELGDGTNIDKNSPVQIGNASNWASVSAGYYYTLALKTDGTLWAWGANVGQLGDGTTTKRSNPVQIGSANNWKSISAGYQNTLAIKTDGTLWAWGLNSYGELGNGTTTQRTSPLQLGSSNNWASASAGWHHSVTIKTDGTLWAWGFNLNGQLGDGTITQRTSPIQIGSSNSWSILSAGNKHTLAIKTDGTLWAWGRNFSGQLGDGTNIDKNNIAQIGSASNWKSISAGEAHTVAIKTDGTLWTWGTNEYGELGDGSLIDKNIPTPIACPIALPLFLINFSAHKEINAINLAWQTTNEVNTSHFTIQRSVNGTSFSNLGKVAAKGDGNYSYTDDLSTITHELSPIYYRLQMVDKDGSFTYSKVVAVTINDNRKTLVLFPNPVKDNLFVQMTSTKAEKLTLQVTDLQGRLLQQEATQVGVGNVSLSVNTSALAKGTYVLLVKTNSGVQQKQFVKE